MKPNTDRPLETELVEASFNNAYKEVMALGTAIESRQAGIESSLATIASDVGDVTALTTEDKDNLVEAINEVNTKAGNNTTAIGALAPALAEAQFDISTLQSTKVNGHALSGDVTVTKADVGLGNVANVGSSATPASAGTDNFTTGGAYTELAKKADVSATGSNTDLETTTKTTLVAAINEVKAEVGTKANSSALNNYAALGIVAEEFDPTKTYSVGDYCIYFGELYKCVIEHTGAWWDPDFTSVTVMDEISSGGGGSGDVKSTAIDFEFSSGNSYNPGDTVMYEGEWYICTNAHSGAWTGSDFTKEQLATVLKNVSTTAGNAVPASGDTTIAGVKTFSSAPKLSTAKSADYLKTDSNGSVSKGTSDATPTNNSTNLLQSGGAYTAILAKLNLDNVATSFDTTKNYAVGAFTVYEGVLYKCTISHPAGAWNSGDFTSVILTNELGSGGGGSTDLIADEFSTLISYTGGDFVIYQGDLYICTQNHMGAWDANDFTNVGSVTDLIKQVNQAVSGKSDLTNIAAPFASGLYTVGKYCTKDGVLYRCTALHNGAWNASHFTAVALANDVQTNTTRINSLQNNKQDSIAYVVSDQDSLANWLSYPNEFPLVYILPGNYVVGGAAKSVTEGTEHKVIGIGQVVITIQNLNITTGGLGLFNFFTGIENITFKCKLNGTVSGTQSLFKGCSNIKNCKVVFMDEYVDFAVTVFDVCKNISKVDISSEAAPWGLSNTNTNRMFSGCVGVEDCTADLVSPAYQGIYLVGMESCTRVRFCDMYLRSQGNSQPFPTRYSNSTPAETYSSTYACADTGNGGFNA